MTLIASHRKEIPKSSWTWDREAGELSLGLTFLKLFGEDAEHVPDDFKHQVIESFESVEPTEKVAFYRKTEHLINNKQYYVEWVGEVMERADDGSPAKMAGFAELGSSKDDFTLTINQEAMFFVRLMDNIKESVFFKDLESRFIKINKSCAQKFGLDDPADIIGKTDFDFFDEEHARPAFEDEQRVIETEEPIYQKLEEEIFADGRRRWTSTSKLPLYDDKGVLIGTYGITRDLTPEMEVREELKRRDELFNELSQKAPGFLYLHKVNPDGQVTFPFVSAGIQDVLELAKEDLKDSMEPLIRRVHRPDVRRVLESIQRSVDEQAEWDCEYRVVLPEKGLRWVRGRATPVLQEDGSVLSSGFVADITAQKHTEKELQETLVVIGDQNKRLLNFAHIVSHNLRNHAGNIAMLLSLYTEEESEEEREELMDYLNQASERLNESIQDLNEVMDQQYKTSSELKKLKPADTIENVKLILTSELLTHNVLLREKIDENLSINYNPAYLESIILNLLSNAIKYRKADIQPEIDIKLYEKEGSAYLEVSDNGLGIDLEQHGDKLFGMYKTFHGNENAKGIGLFITKNQIESLGGSIEVESTPGKGTTFKIKLT